MPLRSLFCKLGCTDIHQSRPPASMISNGVNSPFVQLTLTRSSEIELDDDVEGAAAELARIDGGVVSAAINSNRHAKGRWRCRYSFWTASMT